MQAVNVNTEMRNSTSLIIKILEELGKSQKGDSHVILTGDEKAAAELLKRFEEGGEKLDSLCVMTPGAAADDVERVLKNTPHEGIPVAVLLDSETGEKYYIFDKKDYLFMKEVEAEALGRARSIKQVETYKLVMDESRTRDYALASIDGLSYRTINRFGELATYPLYDKNGQKMNWQYSVEKSQNNPGLYTLRFPSKSNGTEVEPVVKGLIMQAVLEEKVPELGIKERADYKENVIKGAVDRFEKNYMNPVVKNTTLTAEDKEYLAECEKWNKPSYYLTNGGSELIEVKSGSYTIYRKPTVGVLKGITHDDYTRYAKVEQAVGTEGKFAVEDEFKLVNELTAKKKVVEVTEGYADMFKNLYKDIDKVADPEAYKKAEDEKIRVSNKAIDTLYYDDIGVEAEWNEVKTICDYNRTAIATIGALVQNNADLSELREHGFAELVAKYVPEENSMYAGSKNRELLEDAKELDRWAEMDNIDGFCTSGKYLRSQLMQRIDEAAKETSAMMREYSVHSNMVEDLQKMPIEQVIAVYNQKAYETPVKAKVMEMDEAEKAAFVAKLKEENIIFHDKPYEAPENNENTEER